jgi:hypothetical protein
MCVKGRYAQSRINEIALLDIKFLDFYNSHTVTIQAYVEDKVVGRHDIIYKESQCCCKKKASAEAQKQGKFKPEPHENNAINIDNFSDKFNSWMSSQKSRSLWTT